MYAMIEKYVARYKKRAYRRDYEKAVCGECTSLFCPRESLAVCEPCYRTIPPKDLNNLINELQKTIDNLEAGTDGAGKAIQ